MSCLPRRFLPNPYKGARAVLATCHGKAAVIAPALNEATGLQVVVPSSIDTDRFGTFTGEVPRHLPMRDTARAKARMGMAAAGLHLGLASEGSFGPHPSIPFIPAARELLLFVDEDRGLEIAEESLSERTNFAAIELTPETDLDAFLAQIDFPEHAVIVRGEAILIKGITHRDGLDEAIRRAGLRGGVQIETDMRAHMNPTRMGEIGRLAENLARRIANLCPGCGAPGFGVVRCDAGLPCEDCGAETGLTRAVVSGCVLCAHEESGPRRDGRTSAKPAECPECNP